jgi:Helix-turn-helix domain
MRDSPIRPEELLGQVVDLIAALLIEKLRPEFRAAPGLHQRLLPVKGGAAYLGRSENSIRHLIASGKLPVVKIDQRLFLDVVDLERIIAESKSSRG